ncbi:MAG TPA: S24/S26 family peptidase [Candidatus Binataceae bacterium]|nr:S24/S26 family peptidase [Candidatus Binataceae bacterium]
MAAVLAEMAAFDRVGCALIAQALRAARGPVMLRVGGSSMVPAIWPGDIIEVSSVNDRSLPEQAVALFGRDGRLCAHRIVAVESHDGATRLITRGDALAACDPPLPCAEVLGYVGAVIRHGRRIPMASKAPSQAARMLSFAIRNSVIVRHLALGLHARRRPRSGLSVDSRARESGCPA